MENKPFGQWKASVDIELLPVSRCFPLIMLEISCQILCRANDRDLSMFPTYFLCTRLVFFPTASCFEFVLIFETSLLCQGSSSSSGVTLFAGWLADDGRHPSTCHLILSMTPQRVQASGHLRLSVSSIYPHFLSFLCCFLQFVFFWTI